MNIKKCIVPVGILTLMSILGCGGSPQKVVEVEAPRTSFTEEAEGRSINNTAAREAKAHNFVEIKFAPGSASLSQHAKISLNAVIEQAKRDGKVEELIVLSWSDEEYPSKKLKKLPRVQRELAEKRNKAIESFVKETRSVDVDTYNMAEQPHAISKWFNTADSRLKNSLVAAGLPTTADDPQYPSKASHSVVFVKLE